MVAVWTTDHDIRCREPTKVQPSARFAKDQLPEYPVIVVTHAFFGGKGGHNAKQVRRDGRLQPRALTVVDERPEEVTVFDVEPSAAQRVREFVQEEEYAAAIGPHMDELVRFMIDRSMGGASLEKPTDHVAWIGVAERLAWFNTAEASDFVRANKGMPDMAPVLGFARSLANGYAFVARSHSGGRGTHFIGYETNLMVAPGMMLLDATADIDGVSQLCPWREVTEVPQARYDNLAIVHVPSVTRIRLHTFLRSAKNRRDYVNWMVETIKGHMEPGQRGLVVCKHALFENESVPAWPQGDERHKNRKLYTEDFGWEIEGRLLCATHWGSGIGANTWKVADVVVLFDEFYLRRHQIIATAQGLQQHKSTEGELARMKTLNSKAAVVDTLQEGHLLRWMKQMALRGRGRCYDEHGICGHQKLVYTGDLKRLLANKDRVFPGAQITTTPKTTDSRQTRADALLEILGRPGLPETITTKWISQQMGVPWRDVGKNVLRLLTVERAIEALGWSYEKHKGRRGSVFVRKRMVLKSPSAALSGEGGVSAIMRATQEAKKPHASDTGLQAS